MDALVPAGEPRDAPQRGATAERAEAALDEQTLRTVLTFAMILVTGALALGVLWAAPSKPTNRALGAFFALLATNYSTSLLRRLSGDPFLDVNAAVYQYAAGAALPFAYLLFLGRALDTPLVRPFARRGVAAGLIASAIGLFLAHVAAPRLFLDWEVVAGELALRSQPASRVIYWLDTGVFLFALVAAADAFRRAVRGTLARARARAYLLAFGVQDAGFGLFLTLRAAPPPLGDLAWIEELGWPVVGIASGLLLAHAMLRYQLFDLDLRIKRTIRQSTIAAVFVAVVFAVSEGAQILLGGGNEWLGLAAGAALVFALAPLQRLADRVADTAMPRVQDTPEYRLVRKREVYRAALESARQDGVVTEKERDVLATLATELGLSAAEARALEREDAASAPGGAARETA